MADGVAAAYIPRVVAFTKIDTTMGQYLADHGAAMKYRELRIGALRWWFAAGDLHCGGGRIRARRRKRLRDGILIDAGNYAIFHKHGLHMRQRNGSSAGTVCKQLDGCAHGIGAQR